MNPQSDTSVCNHNTFFTNVWKTFVWLENFHVSIENDSLSFKIGYLYYIIENRVCWGKKPGFGGSKSVGSYGFSSRRITGGHALVANNWLVVRDARL